MKPFSVLVGVATLILLLVAAHQLRHRVSVPHAGPHLVYAGLMTTASAPEPAPTKQPQSLLRRVLLLVGSLLVLLYGISQLRKGASELKGKSIDFDAVAKESLAGTKPFTSADGEFKLQYPASWETSSQPQFKFHAETLKGIVNVNVTSEQLPAGATLDAYIAGTLAGLDKVGIKAIPPVGRTSLTVSGVPAARLNITAKPAPGMQVADDLYFDVLIFVAGGKGYVLTCTTEKLAAAPMKPVFDGLVTSMQLTK